MKVYVSECKRPGTQSNSRLLIWQARGVHQRCIIQAFASVVHPTEREREIWISTLSEYLASRTFRSLDRDLSLPAAPNKSFIKQQCLCVVGEWIWSLQPAASLFTVFFWGKKCKSIGTLIQCRSHDFNVMGPIFNHGTNKCVDDQVPHPTPSLQNDPAPLCVFFLWKKSCLSIDHHVFPFVECYQCLSWRRALFHSSKADTLPSKSLSSLIIISGIDFSKFYKIGTHFPSECQFWWKL